MGMNATTCAARIAARLFALTRSPAPADKAQDPDFYIIQQTLIIAEELVAEIQNNARLTGTDSHGDTHENIRIS